MSLGRHDNDGEDILREPVLRRISNGLRVGVIIDKGESVTKVYSHEEVQVGVEK